MLDLYFQLDVGSIEKEEKIIGTTKKTDYSRDPAKRWRGRTGGIAHITYFCPVLDKDDAHRVQNGLTAKREDVQTNAKTTGQDRV